MEEVSSLLSLPGRVLYWNRRMKCKELLGMLPEFTEIGLLPEGLHGATLDEFEQRFVYFDVSDRRFRLFDKLQELYHQARNSGIVRRILVGGSFVTSKPEPNDFDCIIVLDPSVMEHDLRPMEYNLVSRHMARRVFGGDVIPVIEESLFYHRYMRFFQSTRHGEPMGVVEIEL